MDIRELENWLWDIASTLRGPIEANKYKDYILPLIFLKRISDVFDDEVEKIARELNQSKKEALSLIEEDRGLVRFYVPEIARWQNIKGQTKNLGEYLTTALRKLAQENPELEGVIDRVDYNATISGQRLIDEDRLKEVINKLSQKRLGLKDVEADILGRAYEYLLKKFAEGSGQSAGEFYTPKEVAILMAKLLDPEPGMEIYDPCCGSGGLLIKSYLHFEEKYKNQKVRPLKFYGQEIEPTTYAIAKMNMIIHDIENSDIRLGDTLRNPAFREEDGSLKKFDLVVANPPWNQDGYTEDFYRFDHYERFKFGLPPRNSADWGWLQHMYASLKDKGKMAVVLDTGSVSRGSGNVGSNKEKEIRKKFVENDLISAVILLPENLFYNTTAPGVIIVIDKDKKHKNEILLINASQLYEKERPKNRLTEEGIEKIVEVYREWKEEEGFSKIITKEIARMNDYNLSPSRYVAVGGEEKVMDLEEAVVELLEAEEERKETEEKLRRILFSLGLISNLRENNS
ncbi:MAG: N-6 DNA methylase [Candidatus Hydrothermia bacterium]|jgi:type I restriction enzyme M protein